MDEDTDMAYGRVQGTYQGTVTFEEKRDIEKEEENLEKYDFDNPIESRLTHFRRLERLTVLGALYRNHYLQTITLGLMKNSIVSQMLECLQRFCVQQRKSKVT